MSVAGRLGRLDRRVLGAPRPFPQHQLLGMLRFAVALQLVGIALLLAGEYGGNPLPFLGASVPLFTMATALLIRWLIETRPAPAVGD